MIVEKLRAGSRQEPEPAAMDDLALNDLAASALLGDRDLLGFTVILLAGRSCNPRCAVNTRAHRLRQKGFWPTQLN